MNRARSEIESLLEQYPLFVKDVIIIIEYDYTKQMESMDEVINGSLADKYPDIIGALERCGLNSEVDVLKHAKELNDISPDDYEEQWDLITIKGSNEPLTNATKVYNYQG